MLKYCERLEAHFGLEITQDETTKSSLHIFRTRDGKPLKNSKVTLDLQSKAHGFTEEDLKTLQMTMKQKSTPMQMSTENAVLFSSSRHFAAMTSTLKRYFGRNISSIQAYDDHALLVAYKVENNFRASPGLGPQE